VGKEGATDKEGDASKVIRLREKRAMVPAMGKADNVDDDVPVRRPNGMRPTAA